MNEAKEYIHYDHHAIVASEFSYQLVKDDFLEIECDMNENVYAIMVLPKDTSDPIITKNTLVLIGKLMDSVIFNEILDFYQCSDVISAYFSAKYLGVYYFCFKNTGNYSKITTKLSQCVMKTKKELKLKIPPLNWTLYKI
jgi:hypothetical protein